MVTENKGPYRWHQNEVGASFIEAEKEELADSLSRMFGYHLVFMGDPELANFVSQSLISHRIIINPEPGLASEALSSVQGEMDAIPLRTEMVDMVMLCHLLEHVATPHEVLREAHRILIPEGHIVITGFNPLSCWGLWHIWQKWRGNLPAQGKMLTMNRVRDWLTLLNFQIIKASPFYFRPPLSNQRLHQKLQFLERWGKTLWPFLGGGYTLLAVKRVIPLTPIRPRWRVAPVWDSEVEGIPKPTSNMQPE
jgi:SAM-dependent methyltransferase